MVEAITSAQIAQRTQGYLKGPPDLVFKKVTIDSRRVEAGDLFVAIIGEKNDGHDFIGQAWENGAKCALISRPLEKPKDVSTILVDDTLLALQSLAKANRLQCDPIVIGITGSNGKTTTKDLCAAVLGQEFSTLKTQGNLNNHYGLPLTLLELDRRHEMAVLEMGMNQLGEISLLADIAQPNIGILTNIGQTHLEYLGDLKGVAQGKKELVEALSEDSLLIFNGDDKLLQEICKDYKGKKISFGFQAGNNLQGQELKRVGGYNTVFGVHLNGDYHLFNIPLLGRHNVYNAMAAIALGQHFNIAIEKISKGLMQAKMSGMRMEIITSSSGFTIINDVYNANPISMWHALQTLQDIAFERKIVVLGDMLELGKNSSNLHLSVGQWVKEIDADWLFTKGELGKVIARGAIEAGMSKYKVSSFLDSEQLLISLKEILNPGDTILVKGSRGLQMEEIVKGLE